jgi:hypothetical protein
MPSKQEDPRKRDKAKPDVPSTGRGAASAMDALIKQRGPAPRAGATPPPVRPEKH